MAFQSAQFIAAVYPSLRQHIVEYEDSTREALGAIGKHSNFGRPFQEHFAEKLTEMGYVIIRRET